MAIQALGFIFKSLGIKSVPYLPQVLVLVIMWWTYCVDSHFTLAIFISIRRNVIGNKTDAVYRLLEYRQCLPILWSRVSMNSFGVNMFQVNEVNHCL